MQDFQSRMPDPMPFFPEMGEISGAINKAVQNGSVPARTIGLVQFRAGQLVASSYHTVRQAELLSAAGLSAAELAAVVSWRDAPYFSDAERAALALVEAVLTPNPAGERVPDDLYAAAAAHHDDKALWTLVLAISQVCFYIPVALIAKPIPGRPVGQNYSPVG